MRNKIFIRIAINDDESTQISTLNIRNRFNTYMIRYITNLVSFQ